MAITRAGTRSFRARSEVVTRENTRANMAKMDAFKGSNEGFLPRKTFKDRLTLAQRRRADGPLLRRPRTPRTAMPSSSCRRSGSRSSATSSRAKVGAARRRRKRRQRGRVPADAREGDSRRQERRHDHYRPQLPDDRIGCDCEVRAVRSGRENGPTSGSTRTSLASSSRRRRRR